MLAAVRITWSLPTVIVFTASLLACDSSQPTVEPDSTAASEPATSEPAASDPVTPEPVTPEPEPAEPEPTEPSTPPASESSGECQVMLVIEADKGKLAGVVMLQARARNLTDKPLKLTLKDRCPGGEAQFSGLESVQESYDYYHTCTMGMCAPGRPAKVITLPPGELVDISSTQIDPDGDMPCDRPIPAGTYELAFTLPTEGSGNPVLCGPDPLVLRRK
jgi:hypothetical protein